MSVDTVVATKPAKRWGARSIAALVIFLVAALLTPIALVGHWGHRTVVDSERYIETVGPLISNPEVQEGISTTITEALVAKVNTESTVDELLNNLFPNSSFTSLLSAPIAAGVNSLIGELVTRFVASDQFASVWISLNEAAQRGLIAVLEGREEGPIVLQGDEVVLDISAAIGSVQQFLIDSGITAAANITLPDEQRQIVLVEAPALAQIRFIYALTSPILQWLPLLVAALFALSIALARRRARLVVTAGIFLVACAGLLTMGLSSGEVSFNNQLEGTAFGPASEVFWSTLLAYLILGVKAVFVLGLVAIIAGWFGGRTSIAVKARGQVIKGLDELGDRVEGMSGLRRTIGAHANRIRWVIYLLIGLILLASDLAAPSTVLWCTALGAGLVTALQLLSDVPTEIPAELGPAAVVEGALTAE